ncbi:MAG: NUDIX hydrolase [Gemmatimonadota bacterium]|nr:NUDIX hydrolase [Gemmatimonadota bacterium]MDE3171729.1 NUDIX hydrolase [Gemmatimonadota bacterium]MDE3217602.1 NUDIX hydrolase [Gemmatimonadota bacterium]
MTRGHARLETSAGGVVYRMRGGQPLYLLIRDSYQNWGFPKGHIEKGEHPEAAAVREVGEETGLDDLDVRGSIDTIDWYFKFRGRLVHKVCHFFLMESPRARTCPQRDEGISACKWVPFDEAQTRISYANARDILRHAHDQVTARLAAV